MKINGGVKMRMIIIILGVLVYATLVIAADVEGPGCQSFTMRIINDTTVEVTRAETQSGVANVTLQVIDFGPSITLNSASTILPGGDSTLNEGISEVNATRSILLFTYRVNSTDPQDFWVRGNITNITGDISKGVEFNRHAASGDIPIEYSVIEFPPESGVKVQRGVEVNRDTDSITVDNFNVNTSFPIITYQNFGGTWNEDDAIAVNLTGPNIMNFKIAANDIDFVNWQVVDYPNSLVQHKEIVYSADSINVTIDEVNTSKSVIFMTHESASGTTYPSKQPMGYFINGTVVNIFSYEAPLSPIIIQLYVVEFLDDTVVHSQNIGFSTTELTKNVTVPTINTNASVAIASTFQHMGACNSTAGEGPGCQSFTMRIINDTTVEVTRAETQSAVANVTLQVIDFIPSNESTSKSGLVSTTAGATPFYTNISNPYSVTLDMGESATIRWFVNATGEINSTHEFFAFATITGNPSITNVSNKLNITIET